MTPVALYSPEPARGWLPWIWLVPILMILFNAVPVIALDGWMQSQHWSTPGGDPIGLAGLHAMLWIGFAPTLADSGIFIPAGTPNNTTGQDVVLKHRFAAVGPRDNFDDTNTYDTNLGFNWQVTDSVAVDFGLRRAHGAGRRFARLRGTVPGRTGPAAGRPRGGLRRGGKGLRLVTDSRRRVRSGRFVWWVESCKRDRWDPSRPALGR